MNGAVLNVKKKPINILVLGNGFDIAHGYFTKYCQFINFYEVAIKLEKKTQESFESYYKSFVGLCNFDVKKSSVKKLYNRCKSNNNFLSGIKENQWFLLIKKNKKEGKENWEDLEIMIGEVMSCLSDVENNFQKEIFELQNYEYYKNYYNYFNGTILEVCKKRNIHKLEAIKDIAYIFEQDLNELILYLSSYLNEFKPSNKKIINGFNALNKYYNNILCFNYTDTHAALYDKEKKNKYHYIHGRCENYESMVFGTDKEIESLLPDADNEFLYCQKYYQRIVKSTGNDYKNWISSKEGSILFYGFSFSKADSIVIEELVKSNKKIFIYCYDIDAKKRIVSNLSEIISKNMLIELTGKNKITFIDDIPDQRIFDYNNSLNTKVVKY